jgi:hypothetical protein
MITNIFKPIKVLKIQTDHKTGSHLPTPSYKKKKKNMKPLCILSKQAVISTKPPQNHSLYFPPHTQRKKKKKPHRFCNGKPTVAIG